jgi:hypothetical protein
MHMGLMFGRLQYIQLNHVSEVEISTEKLKTFKSPSIDENPTETTQARGDTYHSDIRKHLIEKNCQTNERSASCIYS